MKNLSKMIAIVAVSAVFGGGYVMGQQKDTPDYAKEFYDASFQSLMKGDKPNSPEFKEATTKLAKAYQTVPENPQLFEWVFAQHVQTYNKIYSRRVQGLGYDTPAELSAEMGLLHAAQNQKLIEQNERIIKLLEQQVKK